MNHRESEQDVLARLFETWLVGQAGGESPTLADLCRGNEHLMPELQSRIERKKSVDSLIEEWEELVESGCTPRLEDLCREQPELMAEVQAEIQALQRFDSLFGNPDASIPTAEEMSDFCGGRYLIEDKYASGGLGVLYRAHDRELNRAIVVKTIRPRSGSGGESKRFFEREATVTGQLEHPGIVPVYGFGRDTDGRPYLAMKFVRGETLRAAIQRFHQLSAESGDRALEFQKLLRSFVTVCHTVAFAHSKQIIHRDIKPANIMLGKYGEVLVIDWGLAKRAGDVPESEETVEEPHVGSGLRFLSQTAIKGTPSYMSPEQASLAQEGVGFASDIFSLGATLFELLTGREPYSGQSSAEILSAVVSQPAPRARDVDPETPRPLEAICLKAMRKDPKERYADAQELAKDIERFLADEPVSAWQEPLTTRARRAMKRHRTIVTGLAAAMFVALIATSVAAILISAEQHKLKIVNDELSRRVEEQRHAGYMTEYLLAKAAWENGEDDRAASILDRTDTDLRGIEWAEFKRRVKPSTAIPVTEQAAIDQKLQLRPWWNMPAQFDVSGDGTMVASGSPAFRGLKEIDSPLWQIDVHDIALQKQLCRVEGPGWLQDLKFSADGATLGALGKPIPPGYKSGDAIRKAAQEASEKSRRAFAPFDLPAQDEKAGLPNSDADHRASYLDLLKRVQISGSEPQKVMIPEGLDLYVWHTKTGAKIEGVTREEFQERFLNKPAVAPALSVETIDNGGYKFTFSRNGKDHEVRIQPRIVINASTINPAADLIATASPDGKVRLWSTTNGLQVGMLLAESSEVRLLRFTSNDRLVCVGSNGMAQVMDVPPGPARIPREQLDSGEAFFVAGLPDGRHILSVHTDGVARTWDANSGTKTSEFPIREPSNAVPKITVALDPQGQRLAVIDPRGLAVFDIQSGKSSFRVVDVIPPMAWSPDGQSIVAIRGRESAPDSNSAPGLIADQSETGLAVIDARSGSIAHFHKLQPQELPRDIAFSPDENRFAVLTHSGESIQMWNARTGKGEELSLKDWGAAERIFFPREDGTRLLTVSDQTARVWDVPRWRLLSTLEGHTMKITDAVFFPDKTRVATSSADGNVRVWDARSGSELCTLNDRSRSQIWSVRELKGKIVAGTNGILFWTFQEN